jgi:hypothetical protein
MVLLAQGARLTHAGSLIVRAFNELSTPLRQMMRVNTTLTTPCAQLLFSQTVGGQ